jgi:thymidylate kinase
MAGLIVLSGIDGSGKSSQLAWIAAALAARGEPYSYVRLRWAALTAIPLIGAARLLGYSRRHYNSRSQTIVVEQRYHEQPLMRKLWPPLFALDMSLAAWWELLRPLKRGEWVLCDRFALDAIVDVAAALHDEALLEGRFADQLLGLVPAGAQSLVLDLDVATAFERKPDVLDPAYLAARRPLFLRLADRLGLPVIDGSRSFAEIQANLAGIVGIDPLPEHRGVLPQGVA